MNGSVWRRDPGRVDWQPPRIEGFLFPYEVPSSGGTVTIQVQLQTSEPEITTANNQVTVTLTLPTHSPTSPGGS